MIATLKNISKLQFRCINASQKLPLVRGKTASLIEKILFVSWTVTEYVAEMIGFLQPIHYQDDI